MIIIADAGSTKTKWGLLYKAHIQILETSGYNPNYHSEKVLISILEHIATELKESVEKVFFYGSGCGNPSHKVKLTKILKAFFKGSICLVHHDLLGAARSTCQHEEGIVSILGTGSSICHFDGQSLIKQVTSLGYLIDDYGSGFHLGKELIYRYFKKMLPKDLQQSFEQRLGNHTGFIHEIYGSKDPNKFIASFTDFLFDNKSNKYIEELIYSCFKSYILHNVALLNPKKEIKLFFIGSVAYYFADILTQVATESGFLLAKISKDPLDGLVHFHTQET